MKLALFVALFSVPILIEAYDYKQRVRRSKEEYRKRRELNGFYD